MGRETYSICLLMISILLLGKNVCNGLPVKDVDCYINTGAGYQGKADVTETGKPCMKWSVAVKESKGSKPTDFPDATLAAAENFCRNPDGDKKPWCYTTDATARWEYCAIPQCKKVLGDSCTSDIECSGNVANSLCSPDTKKCACATDHVGTQASKTNCYKKATVLGTACYFNEQCGVANSGCTGVGGPTCQCNTGFVRDVAKISPKQPQGDPQTCYQKKYLQDTCDFAVQCSSQVKNSVCDLKKKQCICETNYVAIPASNKTCYPETPTLGGDCYFNAQCVVGNSHCGYPGYKCQCDTGFTDDGSNSCKPNAPSCTMSTQTGCGVKYTGCGGFIKSPNYPKNYPSFADCTYTIEGKVGEVVTLKSEAFNTEVKWDKLTITYGDTVKDFSGQNQNIDINTKTNIVTLKFISDKGQEYSGFSIKYTIQ